MCTVRCSPSEPVKWTYPLRLELNIMLKLVTGPVFELVLHVVPSAPSVRLSLPTKAWQMALRELQGRLSDTPLKVAQGSGLQTLAIWRTVRIPIILFSVKIIDVELIPRCRTPYESTMPPQVRPQGLLPYPVAGKVQ